jgi:predicted nuclease of predicted toxin-antitoxin system
MSLAFVIDMNLAPEWVAEFASAGMSATHWSSIGAPDADDAEIMNWASANNHIVFTHDLDFGTMLALTHAAGPSVLQVRGNAVLPEDIAGALMAAIHQFEGELASGALVVVDAHKARVRVLPIH